MTAGMRNVAGMRVGTLSVALALAAAPLSAQLGPTARALGAGGAYTAVARGYDALFFNPANLALADNPRWSLALPQFTFGATVAGWDVEDFSDIASSDGLSDSRRAELLNKLPAEGAEGELEVRMPFLALQLGRCAVVVSAWVSGSHTE